MSESDKSEIIQFLVNSGYSELEANIIFNNSSESYLGLLYTVVVLEKRGDQ